MKRFVIPVAIITVIIALGTTLGCTITSNEEKTASAPTAIEETVSVDSNRNSDGELFYGTSDYSADRRAEMQAKWAEMNG